MVRKPIMYVKHSGLKYGGNTGVSLKEAKGAFLSGMSTGFRRKVKIKWKR